MRVEAGADVLNVEAAGAAGGFDGGGAGKGDVVVDDNVAIEVVVVAIADGDLIAALGDGWVGGDLVDAGVDVGAAIEERTLAGTDVADDVNL